MEQRPAPPARQEIEEPLPRHTSKPGSRNRTALLVACLFSVVFIFLAGWLVIREKIDFSQIWQDRISVRLKPLVDMVRPVRDEPYLEPKADSLQTDPTEEEVLIGVVSSDMNIAPSPPVEPESPLTPEPPIEPGIDIKMHAEPEPEPEPESTSPEILSDPDAQALPDLIAENPEEDTGHTTETIRLSIVFGFDSAWLSRTAQARLDDVARMFLENGSGQIRVKGFSDGSGDRAYNLELSRRRADAVSQYLAANGVDASALQVEGLGIYEEAAPYGSELTEVDYSNGRIVQVELNIESGPSD